MPEKWGRQISFAMSLTSRFIIETDHQRHTFVLERGAWVEYHGSCLSPRQRVIPSFVKMRFGWQSALQQFFASPDG
jgi:hypothetical protein